MSHIQPRRKFLCVILREEDSVSPGAETRYTTMFPDFPECLTSGDTPEEAIKNGKKRLQAHIYGMLQQGDPIPRPILAFERVAKFTQNRDDIERVISIDAKIIR